MATKKKATKTKKRKRMKPRRYGVSIFRGRTELAHVGCNEEEEKAAIIRKARKNKHVDEIHVMDRKQKTGAHWRDWNMETHIRTRTGWIILRTEDFQP